MKNFELEKWIWSEEDYDKMGWHDATVYGIRLGENLELDIDYIFKWNEPEIEGFHFTFWVAPSTLIFKKPTDLFFELTTNFIDSWLDIQDIDLKIVDNKRLWTIITLQGNISFKSDAFNQIIRRKPSFQLGQRVPFDERGGFSFDLTTGDNVIEYVKPEINERRKQDFEAYELAKQKFVVLKTLEKLNEDHDSGQLQTKFYLTEKKKLKELINSLTFQLKGTRYGE